MADLLPDMSHCCKHSLMARKRFNWNRLISFGSSECSSMVVLHVHCNHWWCCCGKDRHC